MPRRLCRFNCSVGRAKQDVNLLVAVIALSVGVVPICVKHGLDSWFAPANLNANSLPGTGSQPLHVSRSTTRTASLPSLRAGSTRCGTCHGRDLTIGPRVVDGA